MQSQTETGILLSLLPVFIPLTFVVLDTVAKAVANVDNMSAGADLGLYAFIFNISNLLLSDVFLKTDSTTHAIVIVFLVTSLIVWLSCLGLISHVAERGKRTLPDYIIVFSTLLCGILSFTLEFALLVIVTPPAV